MLHLISETHPPSLGISSQLYCGLSSTNLSKFLFCVFQMFFPYIQVGVNTKLAWDAAIRHALVTPSYIHLASGLALAWYFQAVPARQCDEPKIIAI